jgi:DNA-nicking Smr family endonuclease
MTGRRLSDDEHVLWKGVTRSIVPLRKQSASDPDIAAVAPPAKPAAKSRTRRAPAVVAERPSPKPAPPPLTPLTRKTKQRIARGTHAIDGRLDLHGMTQDEAHRRLLSFLRGRQARGAKVVLIITGKGDRGGEGGGRGVLKRMVPLWLGLPELRGLVIGFENAAVGHGGEGALYVSLRRLR